MQHANNPPPQKKTSEQRKSVQNLKPTLPSTKNTASTRSSPATSVACPLHRWLSRHIINCARNSTKTKSRWEVTPTLPCVALLASRTWIQLPRLHRNYHTRYFRPATSFTSGSWRSKPKTSSGSSEWKSRRRRCTLYLSARWKPVPGWRTYPIKSLASITQEAWASKTIFQVWSQNMCRSFFYFFLLFIFKAEHTSESGMRYL